MPRIENQWLDGVFYIYPSRQDAENDEAFGGTGFFVNVPSKVSNRFGYVYAITNWHVISQMDEPVLRINTIDKKFSVTKTDKHKWRQHPHGDDLAALPIVLDKSHDFRYLEEEQFLTEDFVREFNVGHGDDVFMVGRFLGAGGSGSNKPMVRWGIISQWPAVPVTNRYATLPQDSILVEMRSISGYSGSPVILYIPPLTMRPESDNLRQSSHKRLLGVNWGHITRDVDVLDQSKNKYSEKLHVTLDDALAGVIPAAKLVELLHIDEFEKIRADGDKDIANNMGNFQPD